MNVSAKVGLVRSCPSIGGGAAARRACQSAVPVKGSTLTIQLCPLLRSWVIKAGLSERSMFKVAEIDCQVTSFVLSDQIY